MLGPTFALDGSLITKRRFLADEMLGLNTIPVLAGDNIVQIVIGLYVLKHG